MIALIIANIALVVLDGLDIVSTLIGVYRNKSPIIIKEAKALRSYYEEKLRNAENMAEKAKRDCKEYKSLYDHELETRRETDEKRREANDIERRNGELILRVSKLEGELSSCEDRIETMAKENTELKKKIKELSKPAKKGKNERAKN